MDLGLGGIGVLVIALGAVVLFAPLAVGLIFVILVVSNRADPDPSGRRPAVVYSYAVSFFTLYASVFASVVVVAELANLIGSHHSARTVLPNISNGNGNNFFINPSILRPAGPPHLVGDSVARGAVIAGLAVLVAYLMYAAHVRVADRATAGLSAVEPAGRVRASYLSAVSFVAVLIIVVSLVGATYQVFRIIAPGVFSSSGHGSHVTPLRVLIPLAFLAYLGYRLLLRHAGQLPPEYRPAFSVPGRPGPTAPPAPEPEPATVEVVEVEVLESAPRPRARRRTTPPKE